MERCKIGNSIIGEITLFNGETKHFCSVECVKTNELIDTFKDFVQSKIDRYQYIHKEDLVDFLSKDKTTFFRVWISLVLS